LQRDLDARSVASGDDVDDDDSNAEDDEDDDEPRATDKEKLACAFYNNLLFDGYHLLKRDYDFDIDSLQRPGLLRRRRVCYPHVLLRELVQRGRASPIVSPHRFFAPTRAGSCSARTAMHEESVYGFFYSKCPPDIFASIVRLIGVSEY
jgi:hypothetical protein